MSDQYVRPARAGDGPALGAAHARAWHDAYAGVLPALALEAATPEALAAEWEDAAVSPPTSRHRLLVACDGPDVAGFAALVPGSDEDLDPDRVSELAILVIDPSRQRAGHASRLLTAAVAHAGDDGVGTLVTWVLEADEALYDFLAGTGWARDGAKRELWVDEAGLTVIRQLRLHTSVPDPVAD
ncbi:GNAT family N-acetyltransferase [Streptomyces sp. SID3343]|uniref:GNAT family N-acetyltransferase n=1 Tax=Streptomyces sp. SID3343 TaxID=2690260 RepID=UPI00136EDFED|nr:GNAT family N-acetyltransferase [Streptomyces sp. SID3343]MYW03972.1 GNAT family N-acetyltransferase [Streptomyces sp. SID3343]